MLHHYRYHHLLLPPPLCSHHRRMLPLFLRLLVREKARMRIKVIPAMKTRCWAGIGGCGSTPSAHAASSSSSAVASPHRGHSEEGESKDENEGNYSYEDEVLGWHRGLWFHTIRQRQGLGPLLRTVTAT